MSENPNRPTADASEPARRICLLDGSMGQELIRRSSRELSKIWGAGVMIEEPEIVQELHEDYIDAGARVITINAYSLTPERLEKVDKQDQFNQLQATALSLAHRARDAAAQSQVDIAGSLPPLYGSYQPGLTPDSPAALATYERVVQAQADGVDLFICETMSSIREATAAATAALAGGKPVWVAFTVKDDASGVLRNGDSVASACEAMRQLGVTAVLLNCSEPEAVNSAWHGFADCPLPFGAYANGFTSVAPLQTGGTVAELAARQDLGPETYADIAEGWANHGASIIGGCCEIGPAHIAEISARLSDMGVETVAATEQI